MSIFRDIDKIILNKLFISTGLLGSIILIGEINLNNLLYEFNLVFKELNDFQNKLAQTYSKLFFKKEVNIDQLMHNLEPNLNFIVFDLIEILRKDTGYGNFLQIESLPEYEKIMSFFSKIEEIFENLK